MLKLRHSILNFVADLHLSVRLSDRVAVQGVAKMHPPKNFWQSPTTEKFKIQFYTR